MNLKMLWWKLTDSKKCPYCKTELIEHGFEKTNSHRFTCDTKECKFGK